MTLETGGTRRPPRRAGSVTRAFGALAITLALLVAGYGVYSYATVGVGTGSLADLVVYTYGSFYGGACAGNASAAFAPFEATHHVTITFECPAGTLLSTLLSERNAPTADVVIGLDEVTAPEAVANGLLVPYASPELANVDPNLTATLDPAHHVTPYEWGYLSIDYTAAFAAATRGAISHATFTDFTNNSSWARGLLVEDPTLDITGEEFLLWEIAFYEHVLHQDWTSWWRAVAPLIRTAPDWSTAFAEFSTPPNNPPMVVSYTTDAAYAAYTGAPGSINGSLSDWAGVSYGWQTVYGAGIVNGSRHLDLDRALLDWMLQSEVQSGLPTNEWEYPANRTTALPPSFLAAPPPGAIVPLDTTMPPAGIAADLPGFLNTWQTVMAQYG